MQKQSSKLVAVSVGLFLLGLYCAGCASSKGSVSAVAPLQTDVSLGKYEKVLIEIKNNDNIQITASEKERILMQIIAAVKRDYPTRFKGVNEGGDDPATMRAIVNITQYDKGNAFARAMLAGLGQIKINADVSICDSSSSETLCRYEASKRFAWGGIYGGSTTIETVEEGFAKAVADCICGASEASKGKS
ncbi:DUF4410 domain-containing protein [Desulfobacca acetoxidans]|nr:hypothetical protein [Desulfobacterales bacterium]